MKPYYEHEGITIYCGDCREIVPSVALGADAIFDPPYGCGVKYGPLYNDSKKTYWEWFKPCVEFLREQFRLMVFTHRVTALRELDGWDWAGVWSKPGSFGARLGNSCILPHWEAIVMYGIHKMGTKSRYRSDVFEYNPRRTRRKQKKNKKGQAFIGREKWANRDDIGHPCPKPTDLFEDLIQTFSQGDDALVCDPFCGTGTTLVAAARLGRKAIGIELEEAYCEIAAKRLAED